MSSRSFTVIPAVDIAGGQLATPSGVNRASALGDDVEKVLTALAASGARWIHLVDIDRARRTGQNNDAIADAVRHARRLDLKVQLSGGICDDASVMAAVAHQPDRLNLACESLLNTDWLVQVLKQPPCEVNICLDVRGQELIARGSGVVCGSLDAALNVLAAITPNRPRVVLTDIDADGALAGPPIELIEAAAARGFEVLASGGVRDAADIAHLRALASRGAHLAGVIVGAALHTGALQLRDAYPTDSDAARNSHT